jgi:hypothetical protein
MRHLTTINVLSVCILLAKLSWTTKRVFVKKGKTTIDNWNMIVGKHEMFWGSLAHICIVIALPVHYSVIVHRSSVIILVHYIIWLIFSLSSADRYMNNESFE